MTMVMIIIITITIISMVILMLLPSFKITIVLNVAMILLNSEAIAETV